MDDGSRLPLIISIVILILLSAFFSASETAYSSLNMIRLKVWAEDGNRKASRALTLAEKYDSLLSAILIGNNIVNIAAASIATVLFVDLLGSGRGPTVSTIVLTVAVLIFGEITPKSIAKEKPEAFAMAAAPVLNAIRVILTPFTYLTGKWTNLIQRMFKLKNDDVVTEDELISMIEEAEDDGVLNEKESELIRSAIEFDDLEVESIITHRVDMTAAGDDVTMDELYHIFAEEGYSRVPVFHKNLDNIIGMILEKDFYPAYIAGEKDAMKLLGDVDYTTGKTKISDLLRQLQASQNHMAIVIDEFGGTQGMVTMEDILEEIVGNIFDEHDEVEYNIQQIDENTYDVKGLTPLPELTEETGVEFDDEDNDTLNGYLISLLDRIPEDDVGTQIATDSALYTILKVEDRTIAMVRMEILKNKETEE